MTVNQPNHQFDIKLDDTGFGKLVIKGVHWLEVEMMRIVDGPLNSVFARPHKPEDGAESPDHVEVQVYGTPNSEGSVEFHAVNEDLSVVDPKQAAAPVEEVKTKDEAESDTKSDKSDSSDTSKDSDDQ